MTTSSFAALCSDFYVNQRVGLKLDLPTARDTVLHLFDRVRREHPLMDRFLRYEEEVALESGSEEANYHWLALGRTAVRTGWVNPGSLAEAYRLHRMILELAPFYLSISPLDVEHVELLFGFDVETSRNPHEVVFDALYADSPLRGLVDDGREVVVDAQPMIGFTVSRDALVQAFVEVKTRAPTDAILDGRAEGEPISVYLTVRRSGPFRTIEEFRDVFGALAGHAERLAEERVIPSVVAPLLRAR